MSVTETLRKAYDRDAEGYDARFEEQQRPKARAVARLVAPPLHPARVLDVGCGTGLLRSRLVELDVAWARARWTGVDLSRGMLSRAAGLAPVQADARKLPFTRAAFERVLCLTGLVLPEDVAPSLVSIVRVTKPGGVVALSLRADAWPRDLVVPGVLSPVAEEAVEGDVLRVWHRL